jgi:hypothetical protein
MDITPCGAVKQPPTKEKNLKTLSPRKDYVSLTWTFHEKSRRRDGSVTVRSIAE